MSVYEANPNKLIAAAAEQLKNDKNIVPPVWAPYVKTGVHKEKIPMQEDWWHTRVAAILRQIYINPNGVRRLQVVYGGRKNKGYKPERFKKGSGSIIRKALQQLEKAGYVKKDKTGRHITPTGQKFLDGLAQQIAKQE